MLDLHAHSSASDGSLPPAELIELAEQVGLTALALTDHDTVAGIDRAAAAARGKRVRFVPGVEISTRLEGGTCHLVGLLIDHESPELTAGLERVQRMRSERNPRIVAALARIGMPVSLEEAAEVSGGELVGRPHFARVMMRKGYVRDADEAFERYLGNGGPAHVPKERLEPAEGIRLIRAAGGVPILAHPDQTGRRGAALAELVGALAEQGLAGLETRYSSPPAHAAAEYARLARDNGLVESGGSDFHGAAKPEIRLGRGFGNLHVPDAWLAPIEETARAIREGRR